MNTQDGNEADDNDNMLLQRPEVKMMVSTLMTGNGVGGLQVEISCAGQNSQMDSWDRIGPVMNQSV
ncbi:hypothetical protein E2C01_025434 [Portunus trituberculatus]|uniref:Uncharacterized protein n=1 Tax=Portunus trituberculatus TaxID=210409 RepID=A0A5B7EFS6_PORTR|nr:hypothetical protein [Portunus trituberculatus]